MLMLLRTLALLLFAGALAVPFSGCSGTGFLEDPLHKAEVRSWGPRVPMCQSVPFTVPGSRAPRAIGRAGQAESYLAAGTVYRDPVATIGVADADVVFRTPGP